MDETMELNWNLFSHLLFILTPIKHTNSLLQIVLFALFVDGGQIAERPLQ